jgi:murein DD-endopeptidase MepM/ murein hydrolase activator NlpD
VLVHDGDAVAAGQVIALSGNTGRSTAPHLHFEVRRGGRSIDPLTVIKEGS